MGISNISRLTVFVTLAWFVLLVHFVKSSSWLPSDEFLEVSPEEEESCEMGTRYKRDILGIFSNKRQAKRSVHLAANIQQDQVTPPPPFPLATNQPLPWPQDSSIPPLIPKPVINVHGDEVTPGSLFRVTNQPELFQPSRFPTTTPSPFSIDGFNVQGNDNGGFEVDIPIV